jgi:hypothetical protein
MRGGGGIVERPHHDCVIAAGQDMGKITFNSGTTIINQWHTQCPTAPCYTGKFINFATRKAL